MQKEHTIKPEQDSKVEKKPHLLLPLNRKRKKHRICIIHYNGGGERNVCLVFFLIKNFNICAYSTFKMWPFE